MKADKMLKYTKRRQKKIAKQQIIKVLWIIFKRAQEGFTSVTFKEHMYTETKDRLKELKYHLYGDHQGHYIIDWGWQK